MLFYISVFAFCLVFSYLEFFFKNNTYQAGFLLCFKGFGVFLILIAGFRAMGFDYYNYKTLYDVINLSNYQENTIEPGFALFIDIFNYVNLPFSIFLLFIAILGVGLKIWYIGKNSPNYFLSAIIYFTVYFVLNEMGQIRQGVSMAIVLFSIDSIVNKNLKAFLLKIFVAFLFHTSALIVIPVYFICNSSIKIKGKTAAILILCFLPFIFIDLKTILVQITGYLPIPQLQAKVDFYTKSEEFGKRIGVNMTLFLRIAIIVLMSYYYDLASNKFRKFPYFFTMYLYGLLIFIMFNSIADFALRGSIYFKILEIFILPMIVYASESVVKKNLLILGIVLYAGWSLYKIIYDPIFSGYYLPYKNVLLGG